LSIPQRHSATEWKEIREKYDTEESIFPRFSFTRGKPQNDAEERISLAIRKVDNRCRRSQEQCFFMPRTKNCKIMFKIVCIGTKPI